MADRGQHAAHSGGEFRVLHIEFHIHGELTVMATLTQIIGAQAAGRSQSREQRFGS
jgi:hypothetical protein